MGRVGSKISKMGDFIQGRVSCTYIHILRRQSWLGHGTSNLFPRFAFLEEFGVSFVHHIALKLTLGNIKQARRLIRWSLAGQWASHWSKNLLKKCQIRFFGNACDTYFQHGKSFINNNPFSVVSAYFNILFNSFQRGWFS